MNAANVVSRKSNDRTSQFHAILSSLCLWIGSKPEFVPVHYSHVQLMDGATPESIEALHASTSWVLHGTSVGEELT